MAAWNGSNRWSPALYEQYRHYVRVTAPSFKGRRGEGDCADLAIRLIVDFAEANNLPLTFTDAQGILYSSDDSSQVPKGGLGVISKDVAIPVPIPTGPLNPVRLPWSQTVVGVPDSLTFTRKTCTWTTKLEYLAAVRDRIGAKALYEKNTEVNEFGPQPGDLLLTESHAALVIDTHGPGIPHPKAGDTTIQPWVDADTALRQVNVHEYFRDNHGALNADNLPKPHFDYLNFRGVKKPAAEVIYFRRAEDARADGYEFRRFSWSVLR